MRRKVVTQDAPRSPGIYGPSPEFARPGIYDLTITVESPQVRDVIQWVHNAVEPEHTFAGVRAMPVGPTVVRGISPDALAIQCHVTRAEQREARQDGTTADMVFSPWDLLAYASRFFTLEPGDLLLTGTPAGVGPRSSSGSPPSPPPRLSSAVAGVQ